MNNLKKSFIWNTLGSGLNAFNSLIFLIIVTRINGVNNTGIFTYSFATACLLYCIAIYSGRAYQVTENNNNINDNDYIVGRIFTSLIMIIVSLVFIINENLYFIAIFMLLIIFKAIEAISDVFHGILQKNDRLDIVGKSLFIRSILNISIFLIVDLITKNLIFACLSLVITNIIVLIFIDIEYALKYKKINRWNCNEVKEILKMGFSTFLFTIISNYLVNISRYSIKLVETTESAGIYGIILIPATFMVLCSQMILQPFLVKINNCIKNKKYKQLKDLLKNILISIAIIGVLVLICCYFLGIPVLNILYGIKLNNYLNSLLLIILGSIFYALVTIISNVLIAFRKNKIQVIIYAVVSFIGTILSYILVKNYNIFGASLSYLITMIILFFGYIFIFTKIIKAGE